MSLMNQSSSLNATYLAVYNDFVANIPADITGAARDWLLATHSQSLFTQQQLGQSVIDLETRQRVVLDANTAEITLLRLAIQGLQAGQAAAAPPIPPSATRPKQKIAPPKKFLGHGTPKIKEWLEQVYLYLDNVVDEQLRIKLSLSYLEGDAHDYMDNYYTLVQSNSPLGTWADFVNRLTTSYDTKDKP
ncbi:uncharacterized protein LAESUDRAFT_762663 [Laetiporus sulphureus 93-53]|uniref:Retrotransposon gag domain-containing protein n=1 Tax=Laetiporus sulphureus 93-53 TaxID=1314785 RepID=A0A165CBU9_9APHY|nr:uncharacterized protein LAESUDRAFT_762663 [Laetiporus sulphureus 93-53]KZT02529.1 hypothetical protein LAESUDRAFT_762663 [Laetiporus sulphureus 93-53]